MIFMSVQNALWLLEKCQQSEALPMMETNMNIVVAGAAGFLGSHLCDALLSEGHFVIGVDNFLTGQR